MKFFRLERINLLERNAKEGDSPVIFSQGKPGINFSSPRVELFGNAAQNGWCNSSKAKY
jgi:hypothetical protein